MAGRGLSWSKRAQQPTPQVRVDNGGNPGQMTPLTSPVVYDLVIANSAMVYPVNSLTNASLTVKAGGLLTHLSGEAGLNMGVLNDAVIEIGGLIDVSGKGAGAGLGSGAGSNSVLGTGGGGGHGGVGGSGSPVGMPGRRVAGVVTAGCPLPRNWAAEAAMVMTPPAAMGGSVSLEVFGTLRVDGVLRADGYNSYGYL